MTNLIEQLETQDCPNCREAAEELRRLRAKRQRQRVNFNLLQRKFVALKKHYERETGKKVPEAKGREQAANTEFLRSAEE